MLLWSNQSGLDTCLWMLSWQWIRLRRPMSSKYDPKGGTVLWSCTRKWVFRTMPTLTFVLWGMKAIYRDISDKYKTATVFLTGHSLGGALATLVGLTYDAPAVSFESPGDRLAAQRLHLPHAPAARTPIYHFGHTADPIFVGLCTGVSSACW